jgi:hypothetical protein
MNLGNKVSFGFSAVVAGQKTSGNNEPQLIANSTAGKFTITAPVSRAMGIAVGENIQFVHNMAEIEAAIVAGNDDIKAIAEELNVDMTTREGQLALVEALTQWGIIKGQPMLDSKGNQIMVSARLTEEEKRAFIADNAEAILANARETLINRVGNPNATDEELLAAIELDEIEYPKVPGFTGSKTASTSNATGVGLQLGFTDSNVWKALKKDLGEEATKKNRIYKVLLDKAVKTTVDGKETVIYPIEFQEDADPIVRVANK